MARRLIDVHVAWLSLTFLCLALSLGGLVLLLGGILLWLWGGVGWDTRLWLRHAVRMVVGNGARARRQRPSSPLSHHGLASNGSSSTGAGTLGICGAVGRVGLLGLVRVGSASTRRWRVGSWSPLLTAGKWENTSRY